MIREETQAIILFALAFLIFGQAQTRPTVFERLYWYGFGFLVWGYGIYLAW